MSEIQIHAILTIAMFVSAVFTVIATHIFTAPYGRHGDKAPGPKLSARFGWFLMESPSLFGFAALFLAGPHWMEPAPLVLASLWLIHYTNRTIVFPLRLPPSARPMPLIIAAMALLFNFWNAYINSRELSLFHAYDADWLTSPTTILGLLLFGVGFYTNLWADSTLLRLRRTAPADSGGYIIPRGGLYEYITCPNYFGEVLEWTGFAIAAGSYPAAAFAVYTAANLMPRALAHHKWYHDRFQDYPRTRKAVVPFLL